MHHNNGDHFTGGHYMLTGKGGVSGAANAGKHPFIGAAAVKMTGSRQSGMPAHVAVPHAMSIGLRPGYFGGNYLGKQYDPFDTGGDPNGATFKVQNLTQVAGLDLPRLQNRRSLLSSMDNLRREIDGSGALEAADKFDTQAYELVTGKRAIDAFDISQESDKVRDRTARTRGAEHAASA
jgi:hypothetical protein